MTVSYSLDVAKAQFFGFSKLLVKWKGSIYKILWQEFLVFCLAYAAISIVYRNVLNSWQRTSFERVVLYVETFTDVIPLTFVLGFYVSLVVGRWWGQYETIPWPDRLCFLISSYVHGSDERSRMIRRTLGRYLVLAQVLTFQAVSTSVKRRFPTTGHLVSAGIMTKGEQSVYEKISFMYGKWWLPCHWFSALATRARKEGRIKDSIMLNGLLSEIMDYRNSCAIMFGYDFVSVPLVYTQVVTIATYLYSIALLVGRQYLDPAKAYRSHEVDLYVPFFTLLQFFFYVGWLKVAEQLLNPYGEDDDDFELNWCLDRAINVVYLTVDNLQLKHPKVTKDFFWDEEEIILPQTRHSAKFFAHPQLGSGTSLGIEETEYLPMDVLFEQDTEDNIYKSESVRKKTEPRPSLLKRMISSGLGQSRRRLQRARKSKLVKTSSHQIQAFENLAFESEQEKKVLSEEVLNNSPGMTNNHSKVARVNFTSNALVMRNSYGFQDPNLLSHGCSEDSSKNNKVSRTVSAPVYNRQLQDSDDEEDDFSPQNVFTQDATGMPSIPEEYARSNSDPSGGAFAQIRNVSKLVQEASRALIELNRSISTENQQLKEHVHYVSCCSENNSDTEINEQEFRKNSEVVSIDIESEKNTNKSESPFGKKK